MLSEQYVHSTLVHLAWRLWPDSDGCWVAGRLPQHSAPGAIAVPVRASPGPTEAPQVLASGGLTTGSPQTKRDYAAHGGTVAMMAV